ncbi:MAG: hypothetical protein QM786_11270 [Breznakibacter sp.]
MKNSKKWAKLLYVVALLAGLNACAKQETAEFEIPSAQLKSLVTGQADSLMLTRDPSGSAIGAFRMYGVKLTDDTSTGLTSSISTGDSTLGYQLYFYNEKVFSSTSDTTGTGCPAIFLGDGVTGYKTAYSGVAAFNVFTVDSITGAFVSDSPATLPLPSGSPYRYGAGRLIRGYVKTTYYPGFLIGNTFQGLASDSQPVYVISIDSGDENEDGDPVYSYYAFMVSRFQNGTGDTGVPATDKKYMTILYKKLN